MALPLAFVNKSKAASYNEAEMRKFVRSTISKNKARGSVVVIKNGHAQQISYGYANKARNVGTGDSRVIYPTCSLQKVITGAIIQQLIDKGDFTAKTPISHWFRGVKNSNKITIEDLLTHTSGIHLRGTETARNRYYTENQAIQWVLNRINAVTSNNRHTFAYNNTNYILLADIIEIETGKSYAANVEERIIRPLKLENTFMYNNIAKNKVRAISYTYKRGSYKNPSAATLNKVSQLPGAANMFSTPMDYYKILIGLTNGTILTQKEFNTLSSYKSRPNNYSGGVYTKNKGRVKMAYGNLAGTYFGNWFQMTTDNQNGLVMFLNQTHGSENKNKDIGYKILNHIKKNTFVRR